MRKAAATVELAVCLPILIIVVLGSLSATSMIFMRNAAVQSAYESIKEAVRADGDLSDAIEQGNRVLEFRNLVADSINFSPADVENQQPGTPITVTVVVSARSNGVYEYGAFTNQQVSAQATMLKE